MTYGLRLDAAVAVTRIPRPPAFYWAVLGGIFVLLNVLIYARWTVNGRWTPTPTGPDAVPTSAKVGVWAFQICSTLLAIAAVTYVVRQSRREERLTFDAAVVIGWVLASWQDP